MARTPGLAASLLAIALLTPIYAGAAGVDPDAATPVQREQAQARFARGRELFTAKKYQEALAEFQGSHEIVASPNARLYVAHCQRELGRLVSAYEEFGRAATEAQEHAVNDPRYVKTAESARRERDALAPKLGFVTVTVQNATPETKLTIAGEEIKRAAWAEAVPVLPGATEIVALTPGHPEGRERVAVAVGERKQVTIDGGLPAPAEASAVQEPPPRPVEEGGGRGAVRAVSYIAAGVGVAGFATFAASGLMAKSTYDGLQRDCNGGPCVPSQSSRVSSGQTQQTIANIGLVVGGVGVAAAVTLFVVSLPSKKPDAPAVAIAGGPAWLGVRGSF